MIHLSHRRKMLLHTCLFVTCVTRYILMSTYLPCYLEDDVGLGLLISRKVLTCDLGLCDRWLLSSCMSPTLINTVIHSNPFPSPRPYSVHLTLLQFLNKQNMQCKTQQAYPPELEYCGMYTS